VLVVVILRLYSVRIKILNGSARQVAARHRFGQGRGEIIEIDGKRLPMVANRYVIHMALISKKMYGVDQVGQIGGVALVG
jgi:hypothetical protein